MKVVIVGGVAGGASAAARIRRLDEHAQIIMIERSGYVSYANCGLPYYVGGVIKEQEELTLQTPESFWDRFRIDVRVRHPPLLPVLFESAGLPESAADTRKKVPPMLELQSLFFFC